MTTNKLMLIIVIFVVLAAYYVLGTGYLKGQRENVALASGIDETSLLLMQIPSADSDLKERQEAVRAELESTLNSLPVNLNTTRIIDSILQLGETTGVKVIPVITQSWETESFDNYKVLVFRFNLSVSGIASQFLDFFSRLETGEFETLVIENLQIFKEDDSSYFESISSDSVLIYADIQIVVYAQAPNDIFSEDL